MRAIGRGSARTTSHTFIRAPDRHYAERRRIPPPFRLCPRSIIITRRLFLDKFTARKTVGETSPSNRQLAPAAPGAPRCALTLQGVIQL
jgi:hypothetical protein